jgi:hypothetical protein
MPEAVNVIAERARDLVLQIALVPVVLGALWGLMRLLFDKLEGR